MRTTNLIFKIIRHLRWRWRMFWSIHLPQQWLAWQLPARVQTGPFAGMRYRRAATGSVILPKLLGSYEAELHPFIQSLRPGQYDRMIDIGAGEGYYAVGLCYRLPEIPMLAFERSRKGRRNIRQLARLNHLEQRISVRGACDPPALQQCLASGGHALVIADVEGYELELFDPEQAPALTQADFLVELHPERVPDILAVFQTRFSASHQLECIPRQQRKSLPEGIELPNALAQRADFLMDEFRGPQCWLTGKAQPPKPEP